MLKLQAGSTEAAYLAAIFPLPKTPTLVIMNKGELKEYIAAGVSKEDFISRTAKALGTASQQQTPAVQAPAAPAPAQPNQPTSSPAPPAAPPIQPPASSSPSPAAPSTSTPSEPSPQVQALLSERAARLEVLRAQERKREAEQRRQDKGKAKDSSSSSKPKDPAQEKYSAELKARQQQAREDRARVLQAIEDDKAARRARVSEREAERARLAGAPMSEMPPEGRKKEVVVVGAGDGRCRLQIRLFDGSTVRGEWEGTQTLGGEVRRWLEGQHGMKGLGGGAYRFKVILTPMPSKTIEVGEEGKSLLELGLAPSATLVLVPVPGERAAAYPGTVGGSPATRVFMAIFGVFTGLWALIVGFLGSMLSSGPAPAAAHGSQTGAAAVATGRDQGRKGALRQLRPEREKRNEQQFYNGNSVSLRAIHV